jgi:hypothetical protein
MPRWEYRKIDLNDQPPKTDELHLLNDAGEDEWELVCITANNFAYLKRHVQERASAKSPRAKRPPASTQT